MTKSPLVSLLLLMAGTAWAGTPKTYQVTGPVVEVKDDIVVVQKGKEKWEIAKGDTNIADLKTGDRITIEYRMTATNLEVKGTKAGKAAGKADDKAEAKAEAKAEKAEKAAK